METRTSKFLAEVESAAGQVVLTAAAADILACGSAVKYARTIWAYSAAAKLLGHKECLYKATEIKDYFFEHFVDHKFGGVYASINAAGEREDTTKSANVMANAIFGLSEYASATRDDSTLKLAITLYVYLEKYLHCSECGGYVEAKDRSWENVVNGEALNLETLLHVLEAYVNLYKASRDARVEESIRSLMTLLLSRVAEEGSNIGHQLSLAWLLIYSALVLGDLDLLAEVREQAHQAARFGLPEASASEKLWIRAEAVIAAIHMSKYNACKHAADKAFNAWEAIKDGFPGMGGDLYHSVRLACQASILLK